MFLCIDFSGDLVDTRLYAQVINCAHKCTHSRAAKFFNGKESKHRQFCSTHQQQLSTEEKDGTERKVQSKENSKEKKKAWQTICSVRGQMSRSCHTNYSSGCRIACPRNTCTGCEIFCVVLSHTVVVWRVGVLKLLLYFACGTAVPLMLGYQMTKYQMRKRQHTHSGNMFLN